MVKKGDFVKIEYTGYDQHGNVFDSTSGEIAKQLHGKEGPILIVFGLDHLVRGMQDALMEMKKGEEREFSVAPEKAFGRRSPANMRVFSMNDFRAKDVDPYPGAVIQIESDAGPLNGIVKSVNSGRVLMDFNHPLADQTMKYRLKVTDIIEGTENKLGELVKDLQIEGSFSLKDGKASVLMKKGQPESDLKRTRLTIAAKTTIPEIKEIEFKEE